MSKYKPRPGGELSGQEEVLYRFMVEGYSQRECAKLFGLAHETVKSYWRAVLVKKHCSSTMALVIKHYKEKLANIERPLSRNWS